MYKNGGRERESIKLFVIKELDDIFGVSVCIYFFDCGYGYMGVCVLKFIKLYVWNMCFFLYVGYILMISLNVFVIDK